MAAVGLPHRRCCSLPLLLGALALALSVLALVFGIYAAVVARKVGGSNRDAGAYLTDNPGSIPRGWRAANLFKVRKRGVLCVRDVVVSIACEKPADASCLSCELTDSLQRRRCVTPT